MKIRTGFVSNSSSSSFCIYGSEVQQDDLIKVAKNLGIAIDDEEQIDEYEIGEEIASKTNLEYHSIMGDYHYFGRSWDTIGDNETGGQLKKSVVEEFDRLGLSNIKLQTIEEAWRDG